MESLIKNGAYVDAPNGDNKKPLQIALERKISKAIVSYSIWGQIENAFYSIVHSDKHLEAAETLLQHGADPQVLYKDGYNALHKAVTDGN